VSGQSVTIPQGAQIVTQAAHGQSGIAYSLFPQLSNVQNLQTVQLEGGGEAILIPASSFNRQQIQIGNQILSSPNQVVRAPQSQANSNAQHQVIQTLQGVQFAQIGNGQTVALRQGGNVMQALQMPIQQQQTIPVQIPISSANGQTIFQTIQLPLSALQAVTGGGNVQHITAQVMPQMTQQVQVAQQQMQVAQQGNDNQPQVKQEPQDQTNNVAQNTQQATGQIMATVQLPNGQVGQLVAANPQMWPGNALNLSSLGK